MVCETIDIHRMEVAWMRNQVDSIRNPVQCALIAFTCVHVHTSYFRRCCMCCTLSALPDWTSGGESYVTG